MESQKCRSCGKQDLISILDLGDQPWCNDLVTEENKENVSLYPLHLVSCKKCSLLQLDFTVPKEVMFSKHGYLSGMTKTLQEHFLALALENKDQFNLGASDLVVDIGGNDGTQLLQYRKAGIPFVINVESASNIAKISNSNNISTINKFFNLEIAKKSFIEGSATLVNAAGVFFHLEELHSVIEGIKYILKDDGVFVVQCMYAGSLVDNLSFDMIYHEHLCYYTLQSLTNLLNSHGLKVFDAKHSSIHSGSLIVKACKESADYSPTESLFETKEKDENYTLSSFLRVADVVRKKRHDLKNLLQDLKDKGNKIYAYGAPAKGNTLLNYFGIDSTLIDKAVEINELKVGHLLPMSNIPIEKESEDDYPDYYLLLSHNFADEIIKKNKKLIEENGVKFIIPFPEVSVIEA